MPLSPFKVVLYVCTYWPAVALFLHHHHHQLWFYSSWSQPSLPPGCAWSSHVLSAASHQQTEASEMRRTSKKWKYSLEFPFSQLLCPTSFLQCHAFLWPTITRTWINLNIGFIGAHPVVRYWDFKTIWQLFLDDIQYSCIIAIRIEKGWKPNHQKHDLDYVHEVFPFKHQLNKTSTFSRECWIMGLSQRTVQQLQTFFQFLIYSLHSSFSLLFFFASKPINDVKACKEQRSS